MTQTRLVSTATQPLWLQWYHTDGTSETALMGTNVLNRTSKALTLTQVELADAGGYYAVITNDLGSVTSRVAQLTIDRTFTKVTQGPHVTDLGNARQASWGDYDNDGDLDLLVGRHIYGGMPGENTLYK